MILDRKWKTYRLDEIAQIQGGGTPSRSEASYFNGTIPWVTPTDLPAIGRVTELNTTKESITNAGLAASSAKLIAPNSVLFSSRASVGKIAINKNVCTTNQGFANLTPHNGIVDAWFLAYLLCRYTPEITALAGKTTFLEVPRGKLRAFTVTIPPIIEQHRIVARIKDCMERVEEIEGNSTSIDDELPALFPAMLNEKFSGLAKDVHIERLEDVADIMGGGSLPKGSAQDTGKDAVLLVKVGDMNAPGNERTIQVSRAYLPWTKVGNKFIKSGAVIFPKRGGAIATNKKRILGRPALIDPNLMAVIAKTGKVISEYLYYWTQTFDLTDISNGGVIPQLNRKDLAPLEIPVPNLKLQELTVSELEQAEAFCFELRTLFDGANQERKALRESILRKAFTGEL